MGIAVLWADVFLVARDDAGYDKREAVSFRAKRLLTDAVGLLNPFIDTAVPFWGQATQTPSILPPKRDCWSRKTKARSKIGGTAVPGTFF